ncbi:MAG: quinoprotein relay system zinc metallohydrolase 2 [Alphaproteobacteria bacterium]|nr:quinoprotein relay system zinc metallohydrolase 2 [Alphaproteobacteria bacterium]
MVGDRAFWGADRRGFLRLVGLSALGMAPSFGLAMRAPQAAVLPKEIVPGVHVHQGVHGFVEPANLGHIANVGFILGEDAVAVIDSGGSALQGQGLRAAIRALTDRPIAYVIATHMHPDHLFGHAAFLEDEPTFVGHRKLPAALEQRGAFYLDNLRESLGNLADGTEVVMPDLLVDDVIEIDLGGRRLTLQAHGTAHTDNDLTVLDQANGLLFAGDLLFMERCPVLDGSLLGWVEVTASLAELGAKTIVPGHGPVHASLPGALEPQARYLATLRSSVRAFLADGGLLEDAVRALPFESERPHWALFDDTHGRNVNAAYVELEWE